MAAYLTVAEFKVKTLIPSVYVDEVEGIAPGFVDGQLADVSRRLDGVLRKRYAAPFSAPYPEQVQEWLARIVSPRVWMKRGVDATDSQWDTIQEDAKAAWAEVAQAADGNAGLWDLPVAGGSTASAVSRGGPLVYSEQSAYVWTDRQACTGREEDRAGRGTGG